MDTTDNKGFATDTTESKRFGIDATENYEQKKRYLLESFRNLTADQTTNTVCLKKTTSNLFRNRKPAGKRIDVRKFNGVINIDPHCLVAEIEGMATYESIVNATLKYDCLPAVVPELKSITIGGALAGAGIESSSFRYGLTYETNMSYEVLTGDGRILQCAPDNENQKLFYAFPNTYGTLGYALKIKTKLIPAKKYIKLTHVRFNNAKTYLAELNRECHEKKYDYIDGVVFAENEMYLTLGEFVDEVPYLSNYQYLNIYYRSIQNKQTDYLTTRDYIWRWDTDWFWCSKHFYMQNFLMRLLFGKFILNSTTFWKIRHFINTNPIANHITSNLFGKTESVIQDVEIPIGNAEAFLDFFHKEVGIKPIWICPTQSPDSEKQFSFYKMDPRTLYVNFGFWDSIRSNFHDGYFNKKIETEVHQLKGFKSLYSNIYYSEEEFWNLFDKPLYKQLKEMYDKENKLRDLYQKCIEKA